MNERIEPVLPNILVPSRVKRVAIAGKSIQSLVIAANKLAFMGFEIKECWLEDRGATMALVYAKREGPGLPPGSDPFTAEEPSGRPEAPSPGPRAEG